MTNNIIAKKVSIGCDHAGPEIKAKIIAELEKMNIEVLDLGTNGNDSVDYPDYAEKVCQAIINGDVEMGVLICGTGIGISIAANRHKQIRCGLCHNDFTAKATRAHNDANILALGARAIDEQTALSCVRTFFTTEFEDAGVKDGRHQKRIDKMS